MNKRLLSVITTGIQHTWGSADLECYTHDPEATKYRLMEQYGMEEEDAKHVATMLNMRGLFCKEAC